MAWGLADRLMKLLRIGRKVGTQMAKPVPSVPKGRVPTDHVILLDGTLGTLNAGHETNVGRIYQLLRAAPQSARLSLYYEAGVQWHMWSDTANVAMGRGINSQIRRAYGWLASHYRPGDRIFLLGYSRGAYAVRSLAGIMDEVGLLRADAATERNVMLAWRYYQTLDSSPGEDEFSRRFCHDKVEVEMIGVFDTVKALGVRLPFLWMWTEPQHEFHNHALSKVVRHGFQALALDETRAVFQPVLWDTSAGDWRAGWNRCGFAVRTAMWVASWPASRRRGPWPTFHWSGCWNGWNGLACACRTAGAHRLSAALTGQASGPRAAGARPFCCGRGGRSGATRPSVFIRRQKPAAGGSSG